MPSPHGDVVVHFGAEEFFLEREKTALLARKPFRVLEGDDPALVDTLENVFLDPVLFVWDGAEEYKPKPAWIAWLEALDLHPATLVILYHAEKLPAVWHGLKRAKVIEHKKLKPWGSDTHDFVAREAATLGLSLDDKLIPPIVDHVGTDLYALSAELRKLSYLVGKGVNITPDHLKSTLIQGESDSPFPVVEALLDKNVRKTMALLGRYLQHESSSGLIPLLYALMKQSEKILTARTALEKGMSEEDLAARLGMNPWRCKQHFLPQVKRHDPAKVVAFMRRLCDLDYDVKMGRPVRVPLELALLGVLE